MLYGKGELLLSNFKAYSVNFQEIRREAREEGGCVDLRNFSRYRTGSSSKSDDRLDEVCVHSECVYNLLILSGIFAI